MDKSGPENGVFPVVGERGRETDRLRSRKSDDLDYEEAMADVREYVAVYYSAKRLHSTLGCVTPMEYEKNLNKVSGIA